MRAAVVIYSLFLAIEAGLAWAISGNPFLAVAVICGMFFYAVVWKLGGPWGELVRALTAGLITVAGPLYYKAALMPTVLCFIALPHILAATQCFWEIALSKDPAQQNVRMRTIVFTVAFYAAMALVFVLLRGDPSVSRWITSALAVVVLLAALPGWDLARVTRLKPGHAAKASASPGVLVRRVILGSVVLGMIAALFMGALPAAAEKLCAISPRWKAKVDTPEKATPRPQHPPPKQDQSTEANRPGMDSSAMTGRHELPKNSNIQSTGKAELGLRIKDEALAKRMADAGPVYVRSHTFNSWNEGVWQAVDQEGKWFTDGGDGAEDGLTTVRSTGTAGVEHTVFLPDADGYSLPALQGVTGYRLSKVYGVAGELYQMQALGNIRYDAVSTPLIWDQLPGQDKLRAGATGVEAETRVPGGSSITQLTYREPLLRPENNLTLADKINGIRTWLQENVRYSTKTKGNELLSPLDNFLMGERKGYCDFYASAACILLRYSAVPTRIAYGYAGNNYDPDENIFTFSDDSAHAWTEIYVAGIGWTVCDFTPPANIGHLNQKTAQRPPFDEKSFEETEKKTPKKEDKPAEEFSLAAWWDEVLKKLLAMDTRDLMKEALKWLAVLLVIGLLTRWMVMRKKAAAEKDSFTADGTQPVYFAEFLRIFREAGFPRLPGSTPREYYDTLLNRGAAGPEFSGMMSYHYRSRYADTPADPAEENAWLTLVRETEARLKQARQQA